MAGSKRDTISEAEVRSELDRIVSSKVFARSERMKRFIRYAVEQSLLNGGASLKEYAIAMAVYDKPQSFDPRIDPIVRVEASRLRAKLREYYEDEGRNDPIVVTIRKRGYSAVCRKRKTRTLRSSAALPQEMVPGGTDNSEAQHLYFKGRYYWNRRSAEGLTEAAACFKQAIALDSQYALAHAGLADCYASQAWLEADLPLHLWHAAEAAARRALAIEPSCIQASATLACKQALYDWNWTSAELSFRDAVTRGPRYATARHWYAIFCLAPQRRLRAALTEVTNACELDPLSSAIGTHLGSILYFRRQYQEAIEQYQRAIEVDPGFHLAYRHLGLAYAQLAQFDNALRVLNQALEIGHRETAAIAALALVYGGMGRTSDAEHLLDDLKKRSATAYVSAVNFALIHTALNDHDAAFEWLNKAREEHASRIVHLKVEPAFDRLKTDGRFLSILSSLNLL